MYIEFFMEILRFLTHLGFFFAITAYYGFPLHVIRPMFMSWRSFMRSLVTLLKARKVTSDMNRRFPDATPDELREAGICISCRHDMSNGKKVLDVACSATAQ
jgi:E3 ubiquitin-protein ligase synoviolin